MNKRHKHYEVIVAWAEGKDVQFKYWDEKQWRDWGYTSCPSFTVTSEWRIKPEPKPDVVVELKAFDGEAWISRDANLRLTFSGEDGRLIKAEVINV